MNSTFQQVILLRNSRYMTNYLNNYATCLDPEILNRWFHQAAQLPGNYDDDTGVHRNAWLQEYYKEYVSKKVRKDTNLTDRQLFPFVPEIKVPPAPDKDQQRTSLLLPTTNQATGRIYRGPNEINVIPAELNK